MIRFNVMEISKNKIVFKNFKNLFYLGFFNVRKVFIGWIPSDIYELLLLLGPHIPEGMCMQFRGILPAKIP